MDLIQVINALQKAEIKTQQNGVIVLSTKEPEIGHILARSKTNGEISLIVVDDEKNVLEQIALASETPKTVILVIEGKTIEDVSSVGIAALGAIGEAKPKHMICKEVLNGLICELEFKASNQERVQRELEGMFPINSGIKCYWKKKELQKRKTIFTNIPLSCEDAEGLIILQRD